MRPGYAHSKVRGRVVVQLLVYLKKQVLGQGRGVVVSHGVQAQQGKGACSGAVAKPS